MSTKNLSKTSIEGGRTGAYKHEVARSRDERRAGERVYLRAVTVDPEVADALVVPADGPLSGGDKFHDKLRPMERFLESCVGRPWAKVRSEVFEKFDSRTTAGRHILFDHLLKSVNESGTDVGLERYRSYFVDRYGILRADPNTFRKHKAPPPFPDDKRRAVANWLGARKVGRCGNKLVWFEPCSGGDNIRAVWGTRLYGNNGAEVHLRETELRWCFVDAAGKPQLVSLWRPGERPRYRFAYTHDERDARHARYRQGRLLDKKEAAFFRSLPKEVQDRVLGFAPNDRAPPRSMRMRPVDSLRRLL